MIRKYALFPAVLLLGIASWAAQLRQIAIIEIPGRPGFDSVALVNGFLVIAHGGAGTVDIFDPAKRRVVAQIGGMSDPRGIAADEASGKVYIANADSNTIAVIDAKSWKQEGSLQLEASPDSLLLLPDSQTLYVANWRNQSISAVDLKQGKAVNAVNLGGRPGHMVLDAERNLIFASIEDRNEVVSISPGLQVVHRFKLNASQPTGLAFDPKAHRIYVAVRYAVLALNPDTGSELGRAFTPAGTDLLWLDSDSGTLFAAAGGGTITVIRTEGGSFQVVDEMHSEVRGHTLAFDPARKLVYMPGGREGRSKLLIVRSLAAPAQQPSSDQVALRK